MRAIVLLSAGSLLTLALALGPALSHVVEDRSDVPAPIELRPATKPSTRLDRLPRVATADSGSGRTKARAAVRARPPKKPRPAAPAGTAPSSPGAPSPTAPAKPATGDADDDGDNDDDGEDDGGDDESGD